MTKLVFTQAQQLDLTKRLQLLVLESIASSGSWLVGADVRFQGGTCLCLSYGSSRFSEDLDFVLGSDKGLNRMLAAAKARLSNTLRTTLPGAEVRINARDVDLEARDARNPRVFTVSVSHPDWYRTLKLTSSRP